MCTNERMFKIENVLCMLGKKCYVIAIKQHTYDDPGGINSPQYAIVIVLFPHMLEMYTNCSSCTEQSLKSPVYWKPLYFAIVLNGPTCESDDCNVPICE